MSGLLFYISFFFPDETGFFILFARGPKYHLN